MNSAIAILIAIGVAAAVIAAAILPVLGWAYRRASRGFRGRRGAERIAGSLAAGVNIAVFEGLLGAAQFKDRAGSFVTYDFVHQLFYVHAVTDAVQRVVLFTITTRSKRFAPKLGLSDGSPTLSVRLGRTTFAEAANRPMTYEASVGAHRFGYREIHYFGNPGRYQHFILELNDAGYSERAGLAFLNELQRPATTPEASGLVLDGLRHSTGINTYGEAAPFINLDNFAGSIGVDRDRVRVLG